MLTMCRQVGSVPISCVCNKYDKFIYSCRDEFDDGLDDDYIGGEEDRRKLETMTEREREEEYYRRAEKREELKKR